MISLLSAARYEVLQQDTGYQILRNGKPFISSVGTPFTRKTATPYTYKHDHQVLADGTEVWNDTSTDARFNYRLEIALHNQGTELEVTFSHAAPWPYPRKDMPSTLMSFNIVPEFYKEADYTCLDTNRYVFKPQNGKMNDGSFALNKPYRWLVLANGPDSVIFDMNPIGVADSALSFNCGACRGIGLLTVRDGALNISWPNAMYSFGGMTAGKIRIKDGTHADYDRDHALHTFHYNDKMPAQHLLSFGATTCGKEFAKADGQPYGENRHYGWVAGAPSRTVTTASGAYYSHQAGHDGHYRLGGLLDGLHIVTFGVGNPTGTPNAFAVSVNGQQLLPMTTVAKGRYLTASLPLWIDNGVAEIELKGDYIVSALSSQLLLTNREDFQARRGFWVTDGHEPSLLFNNSNYKPYALRFEPSVKETVLPEHGKEMAVTYRPLHAELEHADLSDPQNKWLFEAKIDRVGNNNASFEELVDPATLEAFLDQSKAKGKNVIMFSGLHSRHTYPHSEERTIRYLKRFCDEAHKRGIKVINHHDTTLLWNEEAGFRVLSETLDGVNRSTSNQLPGFQYCILSPTFRRSCTDYIKKLVEAGVDALQLDEVCFVAHAGSCPTCREEFHKDTGWYLPVDETNACFHGFDNDMYRAFAVWKQEKGIQWRADLMKELKTINPNVVLTSYGAFHLVLSPWGLWAWGSNLMKTGRNFSLMGKECQSPNVIANARMFVASQKFYNWFRYGYNIPIYTWCSTQDWKTSYFAFCGNLMMAQLPLDFAGGFEDRSAGAMPFQHFERNPDVMDRWLCREMVQMGILYSLQSVHNDQSEKMPDGAFGLSQTLEEMHIPYVFLGDDLTADMLKPLKVLSIGSTACLSDSQLKMILDYVAAGGTLLMSGRAGTRNELGRWRQNWPFAEVLGFTVKNDMRPVTAVTMDNQSIPVTGLTAATMEPTPAADKPPFTLQTEQGSLPGVIERTVGKGRILFFPARLEEQFYAPDVRAGKVSEFDKPEDLCTAYKSVMDRLIGDCSLLKTTAPEKVFMTLYREGDQVLVHLLNGLASGNRKGDALTNTFKGEPFPPLEKDITFTVPVYGKHEIFAVSPDFEGRKSLQGTYHDDGTVTVTLPKELLKGYTLVRIK